MRRLFHGRMITVDGHMRRMYPDHRYAIVTNDNSAYKLVQGQRGYPAGSKPTFYPDVATRNTIIIPCKPKTTYKFALSKPGYDLFTAILNSEDVVVEAIGWGYTTVTTPSAAAYFGFDIGTAGAHTGDVLLGSVDILITEE